MSASTKGEKGGGDWREAEKCEDLPAALDTENGLASAGDGEVGNVTGLVV